MIVLTHFSKIIQGGNAGVAFLRDSELNKSTSPQKPDLGTIAPSNRCAEDLSLELLLLHGPDRDLLALPAQLTRGL